MKLLLKIKLFIFLSCNIFIGYSQNYTTKQYIDKYSKDAIKQMEKYNIPASITMAQGILESGNGNSRLAIKANNHFGIKCHNWSGKTIYEDDDLLLINKPAEFLSVPGKIIKDSTPAL